MGMKPRRRPTPAKPKDPLQEVIDAAVENVGRESSFPLLLAAAVKMAHDLGHSELCVRRTMEINLSRLRRAKGCDLSLMGLADILRDIVQIEREEAVPIEYLATLLGDIAGRVAAISNANCDEIKASLQAEFDEAREEMAKRVLN